MALGYSWPRLLLRHVRGARLFRRFDLVAIVDAVLVGGARLWGIQAGLGEKRTRQENCDVKQSGEMGCLPG
jgi:hypothetical protein